MSNIPFILVTGFLGSGKTALLKRFLNQFADTKRIAVIQNEFAAANVDGQELKETGKTFKIVEINKGSVFCVCLLSDFVQSLDELAKAYQPDAIILEATGMADPIAVGQLLTARELDKQLFLSHIWCIIDVSSFLEMEQLVQRMLHQVRIADTVILNKTDLVSPERLQKIKKRIKKLNPHANQIQTSFCDLPKQDLSEAFHFKPENKKRPAFQPGQESAGPPPISTAVLRTTNKISKANLAQFLDRYAPKAYRIKGYVNLDDQTTVSVQTCYDQTEIHSIEKEPGPTELIALGPEVNQQEFSNVFDELVC